MVKNYLITAFRNLFRQKGSTVINIAGLSLGITCSLVLFLLVRHLSSFDNFHANKDRIYRVVTESDGNNGKFHTSGVPLPLPDAFKNDFPEAEQVTFVSYRSSTQITIPQHGAEPKRYNEERGVTFAEPNFFNVFDRKIISGDFAKGLDEPYEAVISKSWAERYFGTADAIGQVLKHDTVEYKITAVMEDAPSNTDLPFNLMLSYSTIKNNRQNGNWGSIWSDEQCYILLKENERIESIEARMPGFVKKYLGDNNYTNQTFLLQPLSDVHFNDEYPTLSYTSVSKETIYTLSVVAIFLIVTACINFINLSTAEAVKRSKEVGIRKTLGSSRFQLMAQFLGETAMVTTAAMIISISAAQLVLSFLNAFLEIDLALNFTSDVSLWVFILGVTVVVAILSGLYPSFIISGFTPALALKNQINSKSSSGFNLRRSLVVLQFVISQFFIIGTIVLIQQMNFFHQKDMGFRKDAIIIVPIPEQETPRQGDGMSKMRTLRDEVSKLPGVVNASLSNTAPASGSVNGTGVRFEGDDQSKRTDVQIKNIDGNYIALYDLKILAGTGVLDSDTATGLVVNEQFVKTEGLTNDGVLGKRVLINGRTLPVIGVVNNFHTMSLQENIEPTVLMNRIRGYRTLSVLVNPQQIQEVVDQVKAKWEGAYAEHIFDYVFLDENIREFYEAEERMSTLLAIFTSIAIFIGCLGLLGLATFMANQKTKEIGVRKVLGASVESIVFLFTKEYVKLIFIGFVLAAPLAWYIMSEWLNNFAYKIDIGPMIFLAGFGITLAIALFTVGFKSLKAAIVNPVKSLKYE